MQQQQPEQPNYNYPQMEESEEFLKQRRKQNIYYKENQIESQEERRKIRKTDMANDFGILNGILSMFMLIEVAVIMRILFQQKKRDAVIEFIDLDGAITILIATYIVYLLESLFIDNTRHYISNFYNYEQTMAYLEKLKTVIPEITYYVSSYHYETNHHRNHHRMNNRATTRSSSSQSKVVTYRDEQKLEIEKVEDVSDDIQPSFEFCNLFRIQVIQMVEPASRRDFDTTQRIKDKMKAKAQSRDKHVDFSQKVKIEGLKQFLVFCMNPKYRLEMMEPKWYYFWTLIGCGMIYRIQFNKQTGFLQYMSKKKISVKSQ